MGLEMAFHGFIATIMPPLRGLECRFIDDSYHNAAPTGLEMAFHGFIATIMPPLRGLECRFIDDSYHNAAPTGLVFL